MNRSQYIQRQAILNIILAQIASDAGKGIFDISIKDKRCDLAKIKAYDIKDRFILDAIKIIDSNPRCGVNYFVESTPDQNGYQSMLVYFDINFYGCRFQVSFHSPADKTSLKNLSQKGRKTHWIKRDSNTQIGSREACEQMAQVLNLC